MTPIIDWQSVARHIDDVRLVLLPTAQYVYSEELLEKYPSGDIYVCDAYVKDIELQGHEVVGGLQQGRLINIDHHAPIDSMTRPISSTPLAIQRVKEQGSAKVDDHVVINHTDCDSVLSAAIMLGTLPPHDEFGLAAIAADHTGKANRVADLLQPTAKFKDFSLSLRNLVKDNTGQPLDKHVQEEMDSRLSDREKAAELVKGGKFTMLPGGLAWALLPDRMDGALFPALLPDAKVIVQANPIRNTVKHRMAIRLGQAAPAGATLHQLGINDIDPAYGGRWNAGNNSRAGGTDIPPEEYVQLLDQKVVSVFGQ